MSTTNLLLDSYRRWILGAASFERFLSVKENELTAIAVFCRSIQCLKQTYRSLLPLFCFLLVCVLCFVLMGHFVLGLTQGGEPTQYPWLVGISSFVILAMIYYLLFTFCAIWFLELIVNPPEAFQRTIDCMRGALFTLIIAAFLISIVLMVTSLLVIPGIYLSVVLLFTIPYLIHETGISPYQSMKSAYHFIKGYWWMTFVSLMLPNVFMLIMMTILIKLTKVFSYIILLKYLLYSAIFLWMIAIFWTVYAALHDEVQVSTPDLTTTQ
jgi:hypothetical protein